MERTANCLKKLNRMNKTLAHEEADQVPISDFFWGSFIERWRKDLALPADTDIYRHYDLDWIATIPNMDPHIKQFDILKENAPYPKGGIIHCFSGNADDAARCIDLGFLISIPGVVTFNKAEILQNAVDKIPADSLLIETDGPFLSPVPKRGKRNEPAYALYTAAKVAEIKNMTLDNLAAQTTLNANKLFSI